MASVASLSSFNQVLIAFNTEKSCQSFVPDSVAFKGVKNSPHKIGFLDKHSIVD